MFDEMFDKQQSTNMTNDELSCDKYRFNSCPKEIMDFLNQIYIQEIKNINPGRMFFPPSTISDFEDKSRRNAVKQVFFHAILLLIEMILILSAVNTFNLNKMINEGIVPLSTTIPFIGSIIIFAIIYTHFHWYGQIRAMAIGAATKQVANATFPVFRRWYLTIFGIMVTSLLIIVYTPNLVVNIIDSFLSWVNSHPALFKNMFTSLYELAQKYAGNVQLKNIEIYVLVSQYLVVLSAGFIFIAGTTGYKKGYIEQTHKNKEEKEIEEGKTGYIYDKAIKELNEFFGE